MQGIKCKTFIEGKGWFYPWELTVREPEVMTADKFNERWNKPKVDRSNEPIVWQTADGTREMDLRHKYQ